MSERNSITQWIHGAKEGDPDAVQAVWEAYFPKLVRLARERLSATDRKAADEEDIAISVFESFFRAAEQKRFPNLSDRDQLWRLLLSMTSRKIVDYHRHANRLKRGGGAILGESAIVGPDGEMAGMADVFGDTPTPELAAILCDEARSLLNSLDDDELQKIAILKLEGFENHEIADQLACSLSTIERRLRLVRKRWQHAVAPPLPSDDEPPSP